ncbi:MAG: ketopantoate reductase family protein [Victivallaceae bacterium]|nr:ketopantoate reductase family protein [Victivallaceae bacterium]
MKVLVIGAGAVGLYFSSRLAQSGAEVAVVARRDYEVAVRQGGFEITSDRGKFFFCPSEILRAPGEYRDIADCVIVASKLLPGVDRVAMLRECVRDRHTAIMLIENGIGIEDEVADAFPGNELISTVAYIGGSRPAPGRVLQTGAEKLEFGLYPSGISPLMKELAALWENAGIHCTLKEEISLTRWNKLLWNLPYNTVSVLSGGLDTREICADDELDALCFDLMLETVAVANACNVPLTQKHAEAQRELTRNFPPFKTSMLQDVLSHRHVEVEVILGNMLRLARQHNIATPKAQTCYALLRAFDKKIK